jgi:hypothetical protein
MRNYSLLVLLFLLLISLYGCGSIATTEDEIVRFSLFTRPFFVEKDERVAFDFWFKDKIAMKKRDADYSYGAFLMRPNQSYEKLLPKEVDTHFSFKVDKDDKEGIYVVTGYVTEKKDGKSFPCGVAKRSFVSGSVVADFLHIPSLPQDATKEYLRGYLTHFKALGGNLLVADSIITVERAFYPSGVCRRRTVPEHDFLADVLEECDKQGVAVLVSLGWDISADEPCSKRFSSLERIMYELFYNYGMHPSFCGFYSYLSGGSLDYALYIRTFTRLVKTLDEGLLTACSPNLEDPLLAGYLASIESLDIIMPQTRYSASRALDDKRFYPARRSGDFVKCFTLSFPSNRKLILPRIELFSPASDFPMDETGIKSQILSVASVGGLNGIALYSYHKDIYSQLAVKTEAGRHEKCLQDSLIAFSTIQKEFSAHPPITVYCPFSKRLKTETSLFDSLDGLRRLGIAAGVSVFVPNERETLPPFIPSSAEKSFVRATADSRKVILLSDTVALSLADCSFIKDSLNASSTLVVSGFPLPTGVELNRESLFGIEGTEPFKTKLLTFRYDLGGFVYGDTVKFEDEIELPFMLHKGGVAVLIADDTHSLVQLVPFAEGRLYVTTLGLNETNEQLRRVILHTLKDAVSYSTGKEMPVFLSPLSEDVDINYCWQDNTLTILLVNHADKPLESEIAVPKCLSSGFTIKYLNVVEGAGPVEVKNQTSFKIVSPARWYVLLRLEPLASK